MTTEIILSYLDHTNLNALGYSIWDGRRPRRDSERWSILRSIIRQELLTLREVAETIASHVRKYKRQGRNHSAIKSHELDLERIKETYYDHGPKDFSWPSTS